MKRRMFCIFLVAEALACVLFQFVQSSFSELYATAAAFPFAQIGMGLRSLSLSGGAGNAAAVVLYAVICLLPVAVLLWLYQKQKLCAADALLGLLSVVLFAVMYMMVNPGLIADLAKVEEGIAVGEAVLGGAVYAVVFGYLILRLLRLFTRSNADTLGRGITVLLCLAAAVFVFAAFGSSFGELLIAIRSLSEANTGAGFPLDSLMQEGSLLDISLTVSIFFLCLRYAADALPYLFNVVILFRAIRLLSALRENRFSQRTVHEAAQLSCLCVRFLTVTVLLNLVVNLLQILFARWILSLHTSLIIPVFSVAFVLAALLLSRFFAEDKQLKEENDLFV